MKSEKKSFWQRDSWLSEDDNTLGGEDLGENDTGLVKSFKDQFGSEIESLSNEAGQRFGSWVTDGLREWLLGEEELDFELPEPVVEEKKPGFLKRSVTRMANIGLRYVESEAQKKGRK